MNITCRGCGQQSSSDSTCCRGCGAVLAGTSVGGRTVVARPAVPVSIPAPTPLSDAARQTVVDRLRRCGGATIVVPVAGMHSDPGQRELTFLIIDISGSMSDRYDNNTTKLEAAAQAAQMLILHKDPEDEIGVISFDHRAKLLLSLDPIHRCKQQVLSTLQSLSICGGTDLAQGLQAADRAFEWHRPDCVRRVVQLTDGQGGNPRKIASKLKSRGVILDIIGIGARASRRDVNEQLLQEIASTVAGEVRYRFLSSLEELIGHYTILAGKTAVR